MSVEPKSRSDWALQTYWDQLLARQQIERDKIWPVLTMLGDVSKSADQIMIELETALNAMPTGGVEDPPQQSVPTRGGVRTADVDALLNAIRRPPMPEYT